MDLRRLLIWALAALVLGLASPSWAPAQEQPAPDAGADADAGTDADADADAGTDAGSGADAGADADADAGTDADADAGTPEPTEAATDAKRVVRIRRVIELDKDRIVWLKTELRERTRWFEDLAEALTETGKERNEKRAELEVLEADPEADPEEVEKLRGDVEDLQEDYELLETQTDLALAAEKTIRKQLDALEKKLVKERHALGRLTGEISAELPEEPAVEPTAPAAPADGTTPAPIPVPIPAVPTPPPPKDTKTSSVMTAAQLQAQKALERNERNVALAKQELDEFVERKRALQRQIEYEEELAQSDQKERENLEAALATMEARLQKYRDDGRSEERIKRRERGNKNIERFIKEAVRAGEARAEYIEDLKKRLTHLEEAQLRITAEVDEAHREAEKARGRLVWLESPIHPKNIAHWARERGPRMLLVIAAALFLLLFIQLTARRIARTVIRTRRSERGAGTGRADTLAFSFASASKVLIVVLGVLLVLQEAGVDITTVLGGAAIIGVAIAFGAQDLMKDYFSGFLILLEDQYQLGDLITIRGITGTVESVNMRVTVLRDLEGRVHFVPNGNIDQVTNRTYAWGRPVFEVPVGFDEDVDRVMEVLVELANELRDDPAWTGAIIGEPDMLGVDKFTDYGIIIKFMVKTQPDQLFPVRRQMLRRIAKRFQELGIKITVPQRLIVRDGPDGEPL